MKEFFYKAGQIAFVFILLFLAVCYLFGTEWLEQLPQCVFHEITNLYCPGCGGTRAVVALLEFQFLQSFRYHPFVLYTAIIYLIFMTGCFLEKNIKGCKIKIIRLDISIYIGIAIILVQFLVKNVYLLAQGVSLL